MASHGVAGVGVLSLGLVLLPSAAALGTWGPGPVWVMASRGRCWGAGPRALGAGDVWHGKEGLALPGEAGVCEAPGGGVSHSQVPVPRFAAGFSSVPFHLGSVFYSLA